MDNAKYWIEKLKMQAHPEGGYFKESYRSSEMIMAGERFSGKRRVSTAIYYLLKNKAPSHFHRIKSDEMWHFYDGSVITIYEITQDGRLLSHSLGNPLHHAAAELQIVIPAGNWFAAEVQAEGEFGLAGCTVAPGFEYEDFELASRKQLLAEYPQHAAIIHQFTREKI